MTALTAQIPAVFLSSPQRQPRAGGARGASARTHNQFHMSASAWIVREMATAPCCQAVDGNGNCVDNNVPPEPWRCLNPAPSAGPVCSGSRVGCKSHLSTPCLQIHRYTTRIYGRDHRSLASSAREDASLTGTPASCSPFPLDLFWRRSASLMSVKMLPQSELVPSVCQVEYTAPGSLSWDLAPVKAPCPQCPYKKVPRLMNWHAASAEV